MTLEEKFDFEQNGGFVGLDKTLVKVGILNKMNELMQVELSKAIEENGFKLGDGFSLYQHIAEYEKRIIQHALDLSRYNQYVASQLLGIKYTTLNSKIKKYDLLNKEDLKFIDSTFQET